MVQKLHVFEIKAATFLICLILKSYEIGKRMKKRFCELVGLSLRKGDAL